MTVRNLTATTFYHGFAVGNASGVTLRNVTATDSGTDGVELDGADDTRVVDSNLSANRANGLYAVDATTSLTVENNTISSNDVGGNAFAGVTIDSSSAQVTVENNTIRKNPGEGIRVIVDAPNVEIRDNAISGNGRSGILVDGPSDVVVTDNVLSSNERGIQIGSVLFGGVYSAADNATLSNNQISDSDTDGIAVLGSDDVTVERNTVAAVGGDGVRVEAANRVTVVDTTTRNSAAAGLNATNAGDLTLRNVTALLNGEAGLSLDGVDDATVAGSEMRDNGEQGLYVSDPTTALVIENNTIVSNEEGGGYDGLVVAFGSAQVSIENNTVSTSGGGGLTGYGITGAEIRNNTVSNNPGPGVEVSAGSDDATVADNVVTDNEAEGVLVSDSGGVTVSRNDVTNNGHAFTSFGVEVTSSNAVELANNTVENNSLGVSLFASDDATVAGTVVSDSDGDGIRVARADGVTVSDTVSRNNTASGVNATNASGLLVRNVTALNNGAEGISLDTVDDATVEAGEMRDNGEQGLYATDATTSLVVANNTVEASSDGGVVVHGAPGVAVRDNSVAANDGPGVELNSGSNDATVAGNEVTDNVRGGILVADSGNVTLSGNDASANRAGTVFDGATNATLRDTLATNNTDWALYAQAGSTVTSATNYTLTGGASVNVSARDVALRASESPPALPAETAAVGPTVNATNTTPDGWLNVTLGYDGSALVTGENESTIRFVRYDGAWSDAVGGPNTLDAANDTVTANVTSFGTLAPVVDEEAVVNLSTDAHDFGEVNVVDGPVGTNVTVTNDGLAPLNVTGAGIVGPNRSEFTTPSLIGNVTVQPGNSADIDAEFDPASAGQKNATLAMAHDASGSFSNVSLSGTGVAPDVNVTTTRPVDFGDVPVGELSRTRTVVVENNGTAPLDLPAASIQGPDTLSYDFGSGGDPTPYLLRPGDSVAFELELLPASAGGKSAYLDVSHNVSDRSAINVTLTGRGVHPNVSVTPDSRAFGEVHTRTNETLNVTVENTGTAPLNVTDAPFSGSDAFTLNGSVTPFVVDAGDTRNLSIDFAPTVDTARSATLSVEHNATDDTADPIGPKSVSLSGTGIGPNASVAPYSTAFGDVNTAESASMTATVSNNGSLPLNVTDVSVSGGNASAFVPNRTGFVVPAGGSRNVTVTFDPDTVGAKSGTLQVAHNASASNLTVSLDGQGIAPNVTVNESALDYGNLNTVDTANATVNVTNDGSAPLGVGDIAVAGADPSAFTITAGDGSPVLAPGESRLVTVEFAPDTDGDTAATLAVEHNASGSPTNVSLSGTGVSPDVNVTTTRPVDFGDVNIGDLSAERTVVVQNNGTAPLDLPAASLQGPNSSQFDLTAGGDPTPSIVQPGESVSFETEFQPDSFGGKTAFLNVSTNVTDRPNVDVTLAGTGVDIEPPEVVDATAVNDADGSALVGREGVVAVNVTVTDTIAVDTVTVDATVLGTGTVELTDADGDDTYDGTVSVDAASASEGTHTLAVTANDTSDNANTTTATALTVDLTNASLTVSSPAEGAALATDTPSASGSVSDANGVADVEVDYGDGNGWVSATDATPPDWTAQAASALSEGDHTFQARAIDTAGNVGPVVTVNVTVDTTPPPAPSTPDLVATSDTGTSDSDDLTNDTTPTLSGTAEANATVEVFSGHDGSLGSTTAGASGDWTVTPGTGLSEGTHTLTAQATDAAGNTGPNSTGLSVTVDATAPATPATPELAAASDSGRSATDDITNDTTPTLSGTAEANATVEVFSDRNGSLGRTTASATGVWSLTTPALSEGSHSLTVTATDDAGNTGPVSAGLSVTVDTTAPAAPSTPDLAAASDTGPSNSDDVTANTTPTLTGTAEAGASVEVVSDLDGSLGTTTADASGDWSLTTPALSEGSHDLTVRATDAAGNTGPAAADLQVTIDTTAPTADAGSDLVVDENDPVSFDATGSSDLVGVTGTAWAFGDGATGTGATPTHTYADPGVYTVTLNASDAAGNVGTDTLTVTVRDTTPPTVDAGPDRSPEAGETLTFAVNTSDASAIASVNWTFDNGTSATTATGATVDHTFDATGTYTVTATVTDAAGNTASDSLTVAIGPAEFSVSDGSVRPTRLLVGDRVEVTARVTNVGNAANSTRIVGTADLAFESEGTLRLGAERVTLTPGESTTVQFSGRLDRNGTYLVRVGDRFVDRVYVETPGTLSVETATLSPASVVLGNATTVVVTVENDGDRAANATLALTANGTTVDTTAVSVAGDASVETALTYTPSTTGIYDLAVDGVPAGTLSVRSAGNGSDDDGSNRTDDNSTDDNATALAPVVGSQPPTDPDGDGVYDDVTGDGTVDLLDVQALYDNRGTAAVTDRPEAFDVNGDGTFDLLDVQALYVDVTDG